MALFIFLWFYLLIGWGASLRVLVGGVESRKPAAQVIFGTILVIVAWPYIIGVRLMG
jgi:hypothetical protein